MPKQPKYRKRRWEMANGNEEWVSDLTLANVDRIYDFLEKKSLEAKQAGKQPPKYSYHQLSKLTGVYEKSVPYCCKLLAYKVDPVLRIRAGRYNERILYRVSLIRFVEKNDEVNKDG